MAFLDRIGEFLSLGVEGKPAQLPDPATLSWKSIPQIVAENQTQTRAIDSYQSYPGLEQQLLAVQGLSDRPWRYPGINEALGTPAIFRAVSLIANTTGSLAMEAYRRGVKLPDEEMPRVIKRPDPFTIPRNFYRDTAYFLATRGEYWWWVGARDTDGLAMSLICVPPWEITIEATDDRLRPKIMWLDKEMRREDMRHGTFLRDDTGYRGVGPLQLCGAAISVAVEAQNWAANFYADGGYPSIVIKSAVELGQSGETAEHEADVLRRAWVAREANTPRVIDPGIESIEKFDVDEQSTGALEGRNRNDGDAARMFGIPGALMEYATSGSSLTYQNVAEVYRQFVQTCLAPNYLEPIEQELSDLLPRTTVARFNVKGLLRADIATRFEVYGIGIDKGIFTPEQAAAEEGYLPGDVEFAPIPFSEPSAVPTRLPVQLRTERTEVRCAGKRMLRGVLRPCNKLLAESVPYSGTCSRCGMFNEAKGSIPIAVAAPELPQPIHLRAVAEPVAAPEPEPPNPMIGVIERFTEALNRPQPQPQVNVTIERGAFDIHTPPVTIAEGAVRVDVSNPVTVEPSPVTIAEGAVRVDVAAPDMGAFDDLAAAFGQLATRTQEAPQVHISEGAFPVTVNVPAPEPEPTGALTITKVDGVTRISREVA